MKHYDEYINDYRPVVELTRGKITESVHMGAIAVVDANGRLLASYGNSKTVMFLRSSAKPIQAISFVEEGGVEKFGFTEEELSLICASHYGTDHHAGVASSMQKKIGVTESDLLCGVHMPSDRATTEAMIKRGDKPTPNRHNCSGKHTGMLANCKLRGFPIADYIQVSHPLQQLILKTNSEMWDMSPEDVEIGIDGCSVPVFGIPLFNAALGFARLCDPVDLSEKRATACQKITSAMTHYPKMIANDGAFDTELMRTGKGKWVCKAGAEGFRNVGIVPGISSFSVRGIGIALKILDGDQRGGITGLVALEVLRQLGAISSEELDQLKGFDTRTIKNWRDFEVGIVRPIFKLDFHQDLMKEITLQDDSLRLKARFVHEKLFSLFGETTWRVPLPPIDELVSTILSQNTNDRNRDVAFESLKQRYPAWEDVLDADLEEIIASIRTAGLANQKGPRIQNVLREIQQERGSLDLNFLADLPVEDAREWLMHFKGVGPKTAAIVLQFSMNIPAFPVDTHIYRVTTRLGLTPKEMTVEQAHTHLEGLFEPENYETDHLNVIRLGREICLARKPRCEKCPLQEICEYFAHAKNS